MGSGRGCLAGDWPSTGCVLNITAPAWTAGFQWWRSGDITRTQNVSEYMLVVAVCLGLRQRLWLMHTSYLLNLILSLVILLSSECTFEKIVFRIFTDNVTKELVAL